MRLAPPLQELFIVYAYRALPKCFTIGNIAAEFVLGLFWGICL